MSTTDTVPVAGAIVEKILPVVFARRIYGINFSADAAASATDFWGGRSVRLEKAVEDIERELLAEMQEAAGAAGANAVIGFQVQLGNLSGGNSFMMYGFAQGTPVVVKQDIAGVELPNEFQFDDEK